jgi:hypothetical protein
MTDMDGRYDRLRALTVYDVECVAVYVAMMTDDVPHRLDLDGYANDLHDKVVDSMSAHTESGAEECFVALKVALDLVMTAIGVLDAAADGVDYVARAHEMVRELERTEAAWS